MRFCVQCGTALPRGAAFCTQCGAQAAPSSAPASGEDAPTQMARAPRDAQVQPGTRLPGAGGSRSGASSQGGSAYGPSSQSLPSEGPSSQGNAAGGNTSAPQGYPNAPSTGAQPQTAASGSLAGPWQSGGVTSDGDDDATHIAPTTRNQPATQQAHQSAPPAHDDDATRLAPVAGSAHPARTSDSSAPATQATPQPDVQQGAWHSSSPLAQDDATQFAPHNPGHTSAVPTHDDDDVTRMAPAAGAASPGRTTGSSAPVTQEIPQQPSATQAGPDDDVTHVASAPAYTSSPSGPPQGYRSAGQDPQSHQGQQGHTSAMPSNATEGYPTHQFPSGQQFTSAQQPPSAQAEQYGSQQPQQPWGSASGQGQQAQNHQQGADQPGPNGPVGNGSGQGLTVDWRPLLPGLLRVAAAILLSMTALGNWWVVDLTDVFADVTPSTHSSVLPLIGCIGVTLAALAQVALLPQFFGRSVPAIGRFAIRVGLCVPALLAVIIAIVTTLGGLPSEKTTSVGVTMLAMAIGFAIMGLDDGHDVVPAGTWRWVTVAIAVLGIVLSVVSFIQILNAGSDDSESLDPTTKGQWLVCGVAFLFLSVIGALITQMAFNRPAYGLGLMSALAAGVTTSALFLGWFIADNNLFVMHFMRNGHGAPLLALALAIAATAQVSGTPGDTATDDAASARRLTAWTPYGYGLAAVGALVTALAFIGFHSELSPKGFTWFPILMILTALIYGACAYLLKTHRLGRVIAVGSTALVTLMVLITFASAKGVGSVNELFSEGAYLWVPIIAALALTVPPSVRRVSGSILPQQRPGSEQPAMQAAGVPGQQYGSQDGMTSAGQQYGSHPQQASGVQASYPSAQPSREGHSQYGQAQNSQTQYGQGGYQPQGYGETGHGSVSGAAPQDLAPQDLAPNEWEERTQLNRRDDER